MKLIAYYSVYNEADFLEYSLKSIYNYVDQIIIIEGAWKENYEVNGNLCSTDNTIKIIESFPDPANKIIFKQHNEDSQLKQRSKVFDYLPEEQFLLFLIDGDEVWHENEIKKVKEIADQEEIDGDTEVWRFKSLTFINDLYTYSPIAFPRLFRIDKRHSLCKQYHFVEPNKIMCGEENFQCTLMVEKHREDVQFHHYSYCHKPEHFIQKKKERTKLHGNFAWEIRDGLVQREGADIREYHGEHPAIMHNHPLVGKKRHKVIPKKEIIVYVEHSGIGNLVSATPMLKAIKIIKPDAKLYVVSWKRASRIIEGLDCIDNVFEAEKFTNNSIKGQIDHLLISPVGALTQITSLLGQRSKHIHRADVKPPWMQHEVERKMLLARKLGYKGPIPACEISYFKYNYQNAYNALFDAETFCKFVSPIKYITIAAAYLKDEHWSLKHWGNVNYSKLIYELQHSYPDYRIIFLGSCEDHHNAEQIIVGCDLYSKYIFDRSKILNLCGFSKDIKDTVALLSGAVLSVGNDSGLQHIANAVGTPTVTIFTFTNPVKNKPFGNRGKIVMQPCDTRLICQHGKWQQCKIKKCLDVPVDSVVRAVKDSLKER